MGGLKRWLAGVMLAVQMHAPRAADMHPLDIPLRDYAWVLVASVCGGFVNWFARVKRGEIAGWSLLNAIGETATSVMAGLLVFYLAKYSGTPELVTIVLVALAGHMGGRAIALLEEWGQRRLGGMPEGGSK